MGRIPTRRRSDALPRACRGGSRSMSQQGVSSCDTSSCSCRSTCETAATWWLVHVAERGDPLRRGAVPVSQDRGASCDTASLACRREGGTAATYLLGRAAVHPQGVRHARARAPQMPRYGCGVEGRACRLARSRGGTRRSSYDALPRPRLRHGRLHRSPRRALRCGEGRRPCRRGRASAATWKTAANGGDFAGVLDGCESPWALPRAVFTPARAANPSSTWVALTGRPAPLRSASREAHASRSGSSAADAPDLRG